MIHAFQFKTISSNEKTNYISCWNMVKPHLGKIRADNSYYTLEKNLCLIIEPLLQYGKEDLFVF
jgi:hypothetical protein